VIQTRIFIGLELDYFRFISRENNSQALIKKTKHVQFGSGNTIKRIY
jgi:hypothetical protein